MTKLQPGANLSGLDITAGIDAEPGGVMALDPELAAVWELAAPYLRVRDNDAQALRLCSQRVYGQLYTAEVQAMALAALSALESVTLWPRRQALPRGG